MSLYALVRALPDRAAARQTAVAVALLAGVLAWERVVRATAHALAAAVPGIGLLARGLLSTALFVGGVALLAAGYAASRPVDVGLRWPSRDDASAVALALVGPVALVGATAALARVVSVPYGALAKAHYGATDALVPILAVAGLGLLVSVPALLLVCQLLVQTPLRVALDAREAVAATTLLAGVAVVSDTGGFALVPDLGRLAAAVVLAVLAVLGSLANARLDDERARALTAGLLAVLAAAVGASALHLLASLVAGAYVLARVCVLAVAAVAYERSDSLLAPALAYTAFALAEVAVLLAGAGGPAPF
ncbi:hypothetical protein GCM10009037_05290 [Halarchaeum grantii]|uniref:Uncharacterized protein n=1 Tax=Halarchaeum grantii TaxID=1193105 RepID=A0A830F9N7_9EURY|nr:hypothetical protein [Halarchaeum grantii]GGL24691.1 hypothetical protein GCM10009037_05290 [Halarchaeum grantii]